MIVPTFAEFVAEAYGKKKFEAPKGVVEIPECAFIIGGAFYFMDVRAELEFEVDMADPSVGLFSDSFEVIYAKFLELKNVETFANPEDGTDIVGLIDLDILKREEIIEKVYDYANQPNALVEVTDPAKISAIMSEMQALYDNEKLENWTDEKLSTKIDDAGLNYMNDVTPEDGPDPDDEYENYRDRNDED